MASAWKEAEEPISPAGRVFLQPEMTQVVYCAIGVERPIHADTAKRFMRASFLQLPRFRSLVVPDSTGAADRWCEIDVDIDRHIIVIDGPVSAVAGDDTAAVNEYLADLTLGPGLSTDKPLWDVHLLTAHRCIVVRFHHALGDGISLMSMLLSSCQKAGDPTSGPEISPARSYRKKEMGMSLWERVVGFLGMLWFSFVFILVLLTKLLWSRDPKTAISGGEGVELWPRKLVTARFRLEDMKAVKRAVKNATINDILFGIISSGLSRYLDHRIPNALQEGLQITGLAPVNVRKQPGNQELSELMKSNSQSRWGNKFGIILLPVEYHKNDDAFDPLSSIKRAKIMLDRKKHSLEALLFHKIFTSSFGAKFSGLLLHRMISNTSFAISNVVGPQEEIAIENNTVTYIRVNASCTSHALMMTMVSYNGMADLQMLVAKDIIPDPEFLAKCFEDALLEMKEAAKTS